MTDAFEEAEAGGGAGFVVDVDGFEGPLDLLLELARRQKVDLSRISILALVEQYLAFIDEARRLRLELAADYLVMAAWLAYLKSRLLLPKPERAKGDEPPAEEMAAQLAFRLAKLDAMRKASEALKERPQLGRDVFARGDPDQKDHAGHLRSPYDHTYLPPRIMKAHEPALTAWYVRSEANPPRAGWG